MWYQKAVRAEVGFDRPVVVAVLLVGGGGGVQSHVFLLCVRAGGTGGHQAAEQQAQTARESLRHPDLRREGKAYLQSIGAARSEARRVGTARVRQCKSRWATL